MADLQDPRFYNGSTIWFVLNEARDIHSRLDQQRAKMSVPTQTPTRQPLMSYRDPDVRGASWDLSIISRLEKGIDTIASSNMRNIHIAQLNTVRCPDSERYTLFV